MKGMNFMPATSNYGTRLRWKRKSESQGNKPSLIFKLAFNNWRQIENNSSGN